MNNFIAFCFHGKFWKKTYWELQLLGVLRNFKEGITLFELKVNWDRFESEHTPALEVYFIFFNVYNGFIIYKNNPTYDYED